MYVIITCLLFYLYILYKHGSVGCWQTCSKCIDYSRKCEYPLQSVTGGVEGASGLVQWPAFSGTGCQRGYFCQRYRHCPFEEKRPWEGPLVLADRPGGTILMGINYFKMRGNYICGMIPRTMLVHYELEPLLMLSKTPDQYGSAALDFEDIEL